MSRDKRVMDALVRLGKAGKPSELPQRSKQLLPTCQGLMDIALVSHIEHQPVFCRVEHPVDGHRQFHSTQVGRQMTTGLRDVLDQKST